jgi:hypothetical protein
MTSFLRIDTGTEGRCVLERAQNSSLTALPEPEPETLPAKSEHREILA